MTTAQQRRSLGAYGERVAARYLIDRGLVLLDRNWRCDAGELDLVLRDGPVLVACEVKTRRSADFGSPIEAVTPVKATRLRVLADRWAEEHDLHRVEIRVDVVGVLQQGHGAARIDHVRGIS